MSTGMLAILNFSKELQIQNKHNKALPALLSVLLGYVPMPVFVIFKIPYE